MKRRTHQNIQLDQSLRQSRSIWLSLAIIFAPGFALGIAAVFQSLDALFSTGASTQLEALPIFWEMFLGTLFVLLDIVLFGRVLEANKRIVLLSEDPAATVRPLPTPFQASLFGPYH